MSEIPRQALLRVLAWQGRDVDSARGEWGGGRQDFPDGVWKFPEAKKEQTLRRMDGEKDQLGSRAGTTAKGRKRKG